MAAIAMDAIEEPLRTKNRLAPRKQERSGRRRHACWHWCCETGHRGTCEPGSMSSCPWIPPGVSVSGLRDASAPVEGPAPNSGNCAPPKAQITNNIPTRARPRCRVGTWKVQDSPSVQRAYPSPLPYSYHRKFTPLVGLFPGSTLIAIPGFTVRFQVSRFGLFPGFVGSELQFYPAAHSMEILICPCSLHKKDGPICQR